MNSDEYAMNLFIVVMLIIGGVSLGVACVFHLDPGTVFNFIVNALGSAH